MDYDQATKTAENCCELVHYHTNRFHMQAASRYGVSARYSLK